MRSPSTDEQSPDVAVDSPPGEIPLLVSGHFDAWWCLAALGLSLIFGIVALVAFLARHPVRVGLLAVSILAAVIAIGCFASQLWRRRWLTWSTDSFVVTRYGSTTEVLDTEVRLLAVTREYRHAVGRIVAEDHQVSIWTSAPEPKRFSFVTRGPLAEPSPLEPLVARLQPRLERRALEELRREGELVRPSWTWKGSSLVTSVSGKPQAIGLNEMSAADNDIIDLRIWTGQDPLPKVRLPQSGADVWLLGKMLESAVGAPGEEGVTPATGLGRILRESRPRSAAIMATMLCGFSATIALLAVFAAISLRLTPLAVLGAGTGMGAILLGSTARRLWRCVFRLHEAGISQRSLTGDRSLKFSEINQFVFDARRQYSKGRYLGTLFTMMFASDAQPRQGILHSERGAYETDEIARIRDSVSEEIAAVMAARLASEGELTWTRELTIRGGILRCEPRRLVRWTGKTAEADLEAIRGFDVTDGWFYVWTIDRERPVFKARTSESNFFPGLLVFEKLLERTVMPSTTP